MTAHDHRPPAITAKGRVSISDGVATTNDDDALPGRVPPMGRLRLRRRSTSTSTSTTRAVGTGTGTVALPPAPPSALLHLLFLGVIALIMIIGDGDGPGGRPRSPSFFADALSVPAPAPAPPPPPSSPSKRIVKSYDLVVVGGGSAGLTAAKFATKFGRTAAIVEGGRLGGDCTWTGCIPSKTLLSCAKTVHAARSASASPLFVSSSVGNNPPPKADWPSIRERIRSVIREIYDADDSPEVLRDEFGVDTVWGTATFLDPKTLLVSGGGGGGGGSAGGNGAGDDREEVEVRAKRGVVIATGATAVRPTDDDVPGLSDVGYITYEEVFDLDEIPRRMTVVGGGPIGCELSQAFSRLGSTVTLVAGGRGLLSGNDAEAGEVLERVFEREGINVVRGRLSGVEPLKTTSGSGGGGHLATCRLGDDDVTMVEGDALLLAVGRRPNAAGLGLEGLGASLKGSGRGGIEVDERLRVVGVGGGNVYAAGDCTGDRQFTHYAGYQGAIAARNILLPLSDPGILTEEVPGTTFTQPEVSSVGMTEEEAKEEYGPESISVAVEHIKDTDRGRCEGEEDGFIKIVYHARKFDILGATIVSTSAGEMISELSVASKAGLKMDQLATVMHSYPTYSFALQTMAADVYYDKLARSKGVLNFLKAIGL